MFTAHFKGFQGGEGSTCQCRRCRIQSLNQEDPLEEKVAIHSSILAWTIPWTEEPGGLQSTGSQRVGHNWGTEHACRFIIRLKCRSYSQPIHIIKSWYTTIDIEVIEPLSKVYRSFLSSFTTVTDLNCSSICHSHSVTRANVHCPWCWTASLFVLTLGQGVTPVSEELQFFQKPILSVYSIIIVFPFLIS